MARIADLRINFIFEVHNKVVKIDEAYRMVAKRAKKLGL